MIFFIADGRLGNQIFQYAFLKTIAKNNEKIVVTGFEELLEVFCGVEVLNINRKIKVLRGMLYKVIKPIVYFLGKARLITLIKVNHEIVLEKYKRESTSFTTKKGLLSFIRYGETGFFQSDIFFDKNKIKDLHIKVKYVQEAEKQLSMIDDSFLKVFVHIRMGDYKDYKVFGKSTLLPMNYFHSQIDWFIKNKKNPYFIFLSDEPEMIENEFVYVENKLIPKNNHFGVDFAIMTLCEGAILSHSSFGWWGSYMMGNRDIVFAPKHWVGFESDIHYGASLTNFMKEINIKEIK